MAMCLCCLLLHTAKSIPTMHQINMRVAGTMFFSKCSCYTHTPTLDHGLDSWFLLHSFTIQGYSSPSLYIFMNLPKDSLRPLLPKFHGISPAVNYVSKFITAQSQVILRGTHAVCTTCHFYAAF